MDHMINRFHMSHNHDHLFLHIGEKNQNHTGEIIVHTGEKDPDHIGVINLTGMEVQYLDIAIGVKDLDQIIGGDLDQKYIII